MSKEITYDVTDQVDVIKGPFRNHYLQVRAGAQCAPAFFRLSRPVMYGAAPLVLA